VKIGFSNLNYKQGTNLLIQKMHFTSKEHQNKDEQE